VKRTSIILDAVVLSEAKKITGISTTRGVVDHALRELVRHHRQLSLLKLGGKIHWRGDLSAMRRMRRPG
jgi:Arc/MetJ family transcription regulator